MNKKKRRVIRLGGYGDPAMLPEAVVEGLAEQYRLSLGYTHQRRKAFADWAKKYCMASVEGVADMRSAWKEGWRTFRVTSVTVGNGLPETMEGEIVCPNATNGVKCEDCGLCDGARPGDKRKSIVILAHGAKSNKHLEV